MVSHWRRRILCLVFTVMAALPITVAAGDGPILFVVPAREVAVRFAFDMATLRSAFVISYQPVAGSDAIVLHVWDSHNKRWIKITHSIYAQGSLFSTPPQTVFLLGTEVEIPLIVRNLPWAREVVRISEFNADSMINTADGKLNFTPSEWRWLAPKYGLQLEDLNWERRRYGRYGPPDKARQDKDESVVIESGEAAIELNDRRENTRMAPEPIQNVAEPVPPAPKASTEPAVSELSEPRLDPEAAPAKDVVPPPVNVAPDPALK